MLATLVVCSAFEMPIALAMVKYRSHFRALCSCAGLKHRVRSITATTAAEAGKNGIKGFFMSTLWATCKPHVGLDNVRNHRRIHDRIVIASY